MALDHWSFRATVAQSSDIMILAAAGTPLNDFSGPVARMIRGHGQPARSSRPMVISCNQGRRRVSQWLDRAPLGRNETGPWFRPYDAY